MQRNIAALALTLLVVTAGCSAFPETTNQATAGQSPSGTSNPTDVTDPSTSSEPTSVTSQSTASQRTVAVAASGQVQTAPNRAVVRVAVTARADSVEIVRQRLAANASRMRTALQEAGINADQITSTQFHIGRNFEHEERPTAPRFRGQHTFVVTLDNTSRAGGVVVTAIQNGATQVEEVQFTLTPETRQSLRKKALAEAVENARQEALVLANGTGLTLAGVQTVQTASVSVQPIRQQEFALAAAGDGGGGGAATSFEGGKVTVTAQVSVIYNATSR